MTTASADVYYHGEVSSCVLIEYCTSNITKSNWDLREYHASPFNYYNLKVILEKR